MTANVKGEDDLQISTWNMDTCGICRMGWEWGRRGVIVLDWLKC